MKRETKAKWIEALLSGVYQQGKGHLKTRKGGVDRLCCLGVLAQLQVGFKEECDFEMIDEDYEGEEDAPTLEIFAVNDGEFSETTMYFGTEDDSLDLNLAYELAELNDEGLSFMVIATRIEERVVTSEAQES